MKLVALDIDPATVQVRIRDTEHGHPPTAWSLWTALSPDLGASRGDPIAFGLTFMLAAQLVAAGNSAAGTVTISVGVQAEDGTLIRTVDYQVRTR